MKEVAHPLVGGYYFLQYLLFVYTECLGTESKNYKSHMEDSKIVLLLELLDRDFNVTVANILKALVETLVNVNRWGNFSREVKIIKKTQTVILMELIDENVKNEKK